MTMTGKRAMVQSSLFQHFVRKNRRVENSSFINAPSSSQEASNDSSLQVNPLSSSQSESSPPIVHSGVLAAESSDFTSRFNTRPLGAVVEQKDVSIDSINGKSYTTKSINNADDLAISLSAEQKQLLQLELEQLPPCWLSALLPAMCTPSFAKLKVFLDEEINVRKHKVFPPSNLIYNWAKLCPLDQVKVVIIGQDPYHNDGQAMGLAFSVPGGVDPNSNSALAAGSIKCPPSLINIYKELCTDIPNFVRPSHGNLSRWAREEGVLLLNTALTVRAHEAASHAGRGWESFTDNVIRVVSAVKSHVVFILWGAHAQKKAALIDGSKHHVLMGVHPSPLSASRGFFGCHHFSKTNEYLQSQGISPVNWSV